MQGDEFKFLGLIKNFAGPAVLLRGGLHLGEDRLDIDGVAKITAEIFAESLHAVPNLSFDDGVNN